MLLTAGERISMALLAMALNDRAVPAVSYTGSQAGILTDSAHGGARITKITGERVRESLTAGKVVIVAGFQGPDVERGDHPWPRWIGYHGRRPRRDPRRPFMRDTHRCLGSVHGRPSYRRGGTTPS